MKTILKTAAILVLVSAFAGCSAQKAAPKAAKSAALFSEALNALEARHFVIEAREFRYTSGKKDPVISTNSYIEMNGDGASVDLGKYVRRQTVVVDEDMHYNQATLTRVKEARNGDILYELHLANAPLIHSVRYAIRLYKDTNECLVKVFINDLRNPYDFKGYIWPANRQKQ